MDVAHLREVCDPVWQEILAHPFVTALGRGQLTDEQFGYFIAQDYWYLQDFSLALTLAASRGSTPDQRRTLLAHATNVFSVEHDLHLRVAPALHVDPKAGVPGAVTVAYTNHLVRTAYTGSFSEIVSALLPCYVTYREIGRKLFANGLPEHQVAREWISTYQGNVYGEAVREIEDIARMTEPRDVDEAKAVGLAYHRSMVYERWFWDQAKRGRNVPGF